MSETIAPVVAEPVAPPVAVEAPVAALSPVAPAEATPPVVPSTVLGELPPAPEPAPIAPVEPAPAPEPAKVEGQSDEPAPPPTYEPFTLPEGATVDPERIGEFTSLLGAFEGKTKADHAEVQALGQQLVERHIAEVTRALTTVQQQQAANWDAQKIAWKDAFVADPEIGGNRMETTVNSAREFLRTHGGTEEQQAEVRTLLNDYGLGNHPAIIRLFAKAGSAMSEGRPLAAQAPAAPPKSNVQKFYGKTG